MTRFAIAILVSALLTLYAEQASAEGRRVALVIGVSAYESVPQLPNAVNDATSIADMFRKANFDVVSARSDVGNLELKRAIREFEDAVTDADIAVVFYAGHGIEIRETNYLIPTDAKLLNERDADDEAISLDRILTALEPAKRLRLVILDACRDNPFASKMKRRVATRAISAGLGKVEPAQSDTLIAYAAKEKSVANDGEGAHSPFTTALLANLTVPGLDVRLAFGRVRDDVLKATGRKQEPFVYGSLGGGTVALVPARAEATMTPAAPTRSDLDASKTDYEIVERVGKKEAWEVYLNTHKSGLYADLARVQLAKLATLAAPAMEGVNRVLSDAPGIGAEPTGRTSPK
ncbi:caspase domain-containing protein, partial [Methylobacterium trifolii]